MDGTEELSKFEQGRADAFKHIRDEIDFDVEKHAEQLAKDFLMMAKPDEEKRAISMGTDTSSLITAVLEPASENLRQYFLQALTALEHGHTVYELTGTSEIYSYHHLTDGNYNAGVHSAANDMQMLAMTVDTEQMVKACLENITIPSAIREQVPQETIEHMFHFGVAVQVDTVLSKVERNIRGKFKRPKEAGIDGGPIGPMPKRTGAEIYGAITDSSNAFAILKGKTPSTWPPFHGEMKGQFNSAASVYEQASAKPVIEKLPDNDNEDFAKGFKDALRHVYVEFQEYHFGVKTNGRGGYMGVLGGYGLGSNYIGRVVDDAFGELRGKLMDQLSDTAKGEGESYEDGQKAAALWIDRELQILRLSGSMAEDPNMVKILNTVKTVWEKELDGIYISASQTSPDQESVQQPKRQPKP